MNKNIRDLLASLPPNYRVNKIVGDGFNEEVFRFITLDETTNLAYFIKAAGELVIANSNAISLIDFPA